MSIHFVYVNTGPFWRKKYPAEHLSIKHFFARKKHLDDQKSPTPYPPSPSRVKWSAP